MESYLLADNLIAASSVEAAIKSLNVNHQDNNYIIQSNWFLYKIDYVPCYTKLIFKDTNISDKL